MKKIIDYFTKTELALIIFSELLIIVSFFAFGGNGYLSLVASLMGVFSLIFNAKGNPLGQLLMVIFSILYSIISYSFSYYGEMITYLCMTLPMAAAALWQWLVHPFKGKVSEVTVNRIGQRELMLLPLITVAVTAALGYALVLLNTANIVLSILSVATSFVAAYFTFRRSPYFALAYALNDIVLIGLWISASISDISYISVLICFVVFLINDLYGFINWKRMEKRQKTA